jgi:hypothetical protein
MFSKSFNNGIRISLRNASFQLLQNYLWNTFSNIFEVYKFSLFCSFLKCRLRLFILHRFCFNSVSPWLGRFSWEKGWALYPWVPSGYRFPWVVSAMENFKASYEFPAMVKGYLLRILISIACTYF